MKTRLPIFPQTTFSSQPTASGTLEADLNSFGCSIPTAAFSGEKRSEPGWISRLFQKALGAALCLFGLLLLLGLPSEVMAQINNYTGLNNGDWNAAGNWSLGIVPTSAHDVVIPNARNVNVNIAAVCNSLTISGGANLSSATITDTNSLTVTGSITFGAGTGTGDHKRIVVGAGTLTCGSVTMVDTGNNNRDNAITITSGTVTVTGNVTMPANATRNRISITAAGTLNLGGTITLATGGLTTAAGSTVNYNGAAQSIKATTYSNLITSGTGIKTLTANTTANGTVTVRAGTSLALSTFTLSTPTSLVLEGGATAGSSITGTGTLTLGGNVTVTNIGTGTSGATISSPVALGNAIRTVTVADDGTTATDLTMSGVISGSGGITKAGAGTMVLSGANTYTGLTTVSAGTLQAGVNNALATGGLTVNGGTYDIGTYTDAIGAVTLTSGSIVGTTGVLTGTSFAVQSGSISAILAGNGTLTKTTAGTVILSGANTYTGNTAVSAGVLNIRHGSALGGIAGAGTTTVSNNAALELEGGITVGAAENLTINGTGVGAGGALRNVSGNNTYGGNITLANTPRINSDADLLTLTGNLSGTVLKTFGGAGNITVSGAISGSNGLTKDGSGILTLSGNNTYTGATTVSAGILRLGAANVLPNASAVTLGGGTLSTGETSGFSEATGTLRLTANSTIALGTGSHNLTFTGSGAAWTAGSTLTITGWTTADGSTGTSGRIFVGNNASGLTAAQLTRITFAGYEPGAMILSTGEVVPIRYRAQFISADLGPSTWCAGETRNVTVTIKNTGSATWTDASPDINIGVKWAGWGDYNVRTDAVNLLPGETGTYTLTLRASNKITGPGSNLYGSPLAPGVNHITFDVVNEGAFWFGGRPGHSSYTTAAQTIAPSPTVNNTSALACSGSEFSVTQLDGTIPAGTTYSWSPPVVTGEMTGGAAGTGESSITGTLVNPTHVAQFATYTVTPTLGACTGSPFTVVVLVSPIAAITPIDIATCDGSFSVTPANETNGIVPGSTDYSWQAPVVTGGVTGGIGGSGSSISGTLANPTNSVQTATYTVTPITGSCVGADFTVTVTVNPKPALTPMVADACSDGSFTITPANGTVPAGTTYAWSAPTVPVGLTGGAAGSGASSITGTLTNLTNTPQTATYTVTPTSGTCPGDPFTVTVTVNPRPVIPAQTAEVCSGLAFTVSPANGVPTAATIVPANTTYTWTVADNPNVTGESNQATAPPTISQTLTNTSNVPQTVIYTVTPTSGAAGTCAGTPFTVTVQVNPSPVIPAQTAEICSGETFMVSPVNGPSMIVPPGITYTWTVADNPNVTGESNQATAQPNISQTLANTSNVVQTVTYTVIPTSGAAGTCAGDPFTVTVTVNPRPSIPDQTAEVCSGSEFTVAPNNAGTTIVPPGTTYTWTAADNPNVTGESNQATAQPTISQTLTNTTDEEQTVLYTVTPTSGTCTGASFTVSVTVNPGVDIAPMTETACSEDTFTVTPTTSTHGVIPSGTTYSWSPPVVTGGMTGGAAGTGASSITGTLTNPTHTAQTATYTVTPSFVSPSSETCQGAPFTVTVTVNPKPAVTDIIAPACTGELFTVTPANETNGVVPSGTTYSWSVTEVTGGLTGAEAGSGSDITGTLVNSTTVPQTATYTVIPTSGSCPGEPFTVTVTVNPVTAITIPPSEADFEVCFGDGFAPISVVATGSAVLGYQWYSNDIPENFGGTPVAGATLASFTPPSTPIGEKYYYVVVTGFCGTQTSQISGRYEVFPPETEITSDLDTSPQTICPGDSFSDLSVEAIGANLTYQWYSNTAPSTIDGTLIPGETNSTFTPPSDLFGPMYYYVEASSDCGTVPSSVSGPFAITNAVSALPDQTVCVDEPLDPVITHTTTGTTGIGTATGLPPGVTATWADDVITISGTPTLADGNPYNYSIPLVGACGTEVATGTITVNPKSAIDPIATSVCTGVPFTVTPDGTHGVVVPGTTYSWSAPSVTGGITGGAAGSGNSITGTLTNPGISPETATYTVIPMTEEDCEGASFTVTVTVNPTPTLSSTLTPAAICNNSAFSYTPTSATDEAVFAWTRAAVAGISNPAVTEPQSSDPNEALVNTTAAPIDVVYAYTITANGCSFTQNVTVTVNPTPTLSSTLTPAALCSDTPFTYSPTSATGGATFTWTRAAVSGIDNAAVTDPQSSDPNEILVNATVDPIDVVYAYTITANGCSNTQDVTVTVNPTPTLTSTLTPAARCSNVSTTYTAISSVSGTSFLWTRAAVPGISNAAASGATATATETLINTTADPIDVTYVYTLTANGCSNTQSVTVTVDPRPAITPSPIPVTICSGDTFSFTPENGTNGIVPAGTTYTWTVSAQSGISGATSGSGTSITGGTLTNSNTAPGTATYTVTPTSGGCTGPTFQVVVTVNPDPTVNVVSNQTLCAGSNTALVNFTGNAVAGKTYTWTNDNPSIGLAASGTGNIPSFTTVNEGVTPVTANITVTPMANGCPGTTPRTFTITVNPRPKVTIVPDYCVVGGKVQLVALSNVPGTWLWNTGQTTQSILVDLSGNYTVTATAPSGCSTTASTSVAQELVVNGDFTAGNVGFTTGYAYHADVAGNPGGGQNGELYDDSGINGYGVGTNGQNYHINFWGVDHTGNTVGPRNMMIVNGKGPHLTIWEQEVTVEPNTDYYFSAWGMSLNNAGPFARLRFEVNGVQVGTEAALGSGVSNNSNNGWIRFYSDPVWNSGSISGPITIRIVNNEPSNPGNDFALDDISFGTLSTFINLVSPPGSDDQTVCAGTPIQDITYTVGSGILGPEVTGLPPGVTSVWNGVLLRFTGSPTAAAAGTYTYEITTRGNCLPATATGTITILNKPTPGTIAGNQTVCAEGDPLAFTSTAPGTGQGIVTYRWESNTNLTAPSWTEVPGQTTATYDVPAGLAVTTQYRRTTLASSGALVCESDPTALVQVTVQAPVSPGAIAEAQTICEGGDPEAFTSIDDGDGDGDISYIWESAVSPFAVWTPIGGATAATYDAPAGLTVTTQYRRITVSTVNTVGCPSSAATVPVQVTVTPTMRAEPEDPDPTLCLNTASPIIVTHTTTGATGIEPQSAGVIYNLPNGVTANWAPGTVTGEGLITISGTPTEMGTFNYSIPLTGECGPVSATGTITVENPAYPITAIHVVNPPTGASPPYTSTFTVYSNELTIGNYTINYSIDGVNGGPDQTISVEVTTPGQFTFTSLPYSDEGTTLLTINSIKEDTENCSYFPPTNNTAEYGLGCSVELSASGTFSVPADVYEVRIEAYGDGSPTMDSETIPVVPGGVIYVGVDGNVIFATQVPLGSATPADWLVSAIGPNGRIVFHFDCDPPEPVCGGLPPYEFTDSEGYTVLRFDVGACEWHAPDGLDEFEVLVVGGGGGGGFGGAAGGGGGGAVVYQHYTGITTGGVPGLQGAVFSLSVGGHGAGAPNAGSQGVNGGGSTFSGPAFASVQGPFAGLAGGGGGGGGSTSTDPSIRPGAPGASGGGGAASGEDESAGGAGTPAGNSGGTGYGEASGTGGGGGGGASGAGGAAAFAGSMNGGTGGDGRLLAISGEEIHYGAGGGGTSSGAVTNEAGAGGSPYGAGYYAGGSASNHAVGQSPTTYGSGGGAGRDGGGAGFPGVIYIRYPNFRILPVEYLHFHAKYNPGFRSGDLTWATAKEWENERFEIERSVNNVADWETIGQVDGAGYSDSPVDYAYRDMKLPLAGGNIFYRLKQVDFDGDSAYSVTRSIRVEPMAGTSYWRVYPNPTTGDPITLELLDGGVYQDEPVTVRIISATGQFDVIESTAGATLNALVADRLRGKAAGLYTLEISWSDKREYHKVVLRR